MFPFGRHLLTTYTLSIAGRRYAGHSKWANIRHIKAQKDGEKSQIFARMSRLLRLAVQEGGSADPNSNIKLSQVVEQAKRANMPVSSIQNILKECKAPKTGTTVSELGLKGPGGTFVLITLLTSNFRVSKQILAPVIKKTKFTFSEGNLNHLFSHKGIIEADILKNSSLDDALNHALEIGAEDVVQQSNDGEEFLEFVCEPIQLQNAKTKLEKLGYTIRFAHSEYIPSAPVVPSETDLEAVQYLYKKLEDYPDITGLYDNIVWNN